MTKKQKMELRSKLRAKFIEKIERRISSNVEEDGLRVMSDYLTSYSEKHSSEVIAFMRIGEDWNFAGYVRDVKTLEQFYKDFGLTHDVMSLEYFVSQYPVMYSSEAVRAIHEWRERNGIGVETAY